MTRHLRPAALLVTASTLALTLSACKIDNRPLLARNTPAADAAAYAPAPLADSYAPAAAAYASSPDPYADARRAYSVDPVAYDQPPQYGFAYDDAEPWAWQTADDGWMYVEPYDDGDRYYYYAAGDDYPYFVRDRNYGYGYGRDGALVALYSASGALLPRDRYAGAASRAGEYWARARSLHQAAARAPRRPVDASQWRERTPRFERAHSTWTPPAQDRGARFAARPGDLPPLPDRGGDRRAFASREPAAQMARAPDRGVLAGREDRQAALRQAQAAKSAKPPFAAQQAQVRQAQIAGRRQQMAQARPDPGRHAGRQPGSPAIAALEHGRNAVAREPEPRAPRNDFAALAAQRAHAPTQIRPAAPAHAEAGHPHVGGGGHGPRPPQMAQAAPQPHFGGGRLGGGGGFHPGGGAPHAPAAPQGGGHPGGGHPGGHDKR